MSWSGALASVPLDDFLAGAGGSTTLGERLVRAGLIASIGGIGLAVGALVCLALVVRGEPREIRDLVRLPAAAGLVAAAGAAAELVGVESIRGRGWSDALAAPGGAAATMRLLGGLLLAVGLSGHSVAAADVTIEARPDGGRVPVRWVPGAAPAFGLAGAIVAVLSFGFDGHTVTEGPRLVHAAANVVHVTAGGVWFGGLVTLAVLAARHRRAGEDAADTVRLAVMGFARVATAALGAAALAGVAMALLIVDDLGALTATGWGRTLVVKLVAVAGAAGLGAYHHFVVVPRLRGGVREPGAMRSVRRTVTVEAAILALVVIATAFLVGASPR